MPYGDSPIPRFFADGVDEIKRLVQFGRMTSLGYRLGSQLTALSAVVGKALKEVPEAAKMIPLLKGHAEELQHYAAAESDADMPYLSELLTIRIAVIIETVVQDAVMLSLEHQSAVLQREEVKKIKGPVVELLAASPSERAEFLAAALAQEVRAPLQAGVGKYEAILHAVGLGGSVDPSVRDVVYELNQVRNVLVHRAGRADARFCESCPWLNLQTGQAVKVSTEMIERYRAAVVWYLIELMDRWAKRDDIDADLSRFREMRTMAAARLQQYKNNAG
jgi:hypothetical protein